MIELDGNCGKEGCHLICRKCASRYFLYKCIDILLNQYNWSTFIVFSKFPGFIANPGIDLKASSQFEALVGMELKTFGPIQRRSKPSVLTKVLSKKPPRGGLNYIPV
jgi:hypothetical protein